MRAEGYRHWHSARQVPVPRVRLPVRGVGADDRRQGARVSGEPLGEGQRPHGIMAPSPHYSYGQSSTVMTLPGISSYSGVIPSMRTFEISVTVAASGSNSTTLCPLPMALG